MSKDQVTVSLTTTLPKLPKDAQDWIASLSEGQRSVTEWYLERMGEAQFLEGWREIKAVSEYWRDF